MKRYTQEPVIPLQSTHTDSNKSSKNTKNLTEKTEKVDQGRKLDKLEKSEPEKFHKDFRDLNLHEKPSTLPRASKKVSNTRDFSLSIPKPETVEPKQGKNHTEAKTSNEPVFDQDFFQKVTFGKLKHEDLKTPPFSLIKQLSIQ